MTPKQIINIVKTGYAVHISRTSASGRYLFVIGRDGRVNMIDLWMAKPDNVAEIPHRSGSPLGGHPKHKGKEGDFTGQAGHRRRYWPPQFVIMNGDTLEPLKIVSTRGMTVDTQEYHPEPRVASIVASHFKPEFIVNVKETGKTLMVDYRTWTPPRSPSWVQPVICTTAAGIRPSATSWWPRITATRSAWWMPRKPRCKPWWTWARSLTPAVAPTLCTPSSVPCGLPVTLGDETISLIGTDPKKHAQYAFKEVAKLKGPGGGALFIKSHPKSQHLYSDAPLNPDPKISQSVVVYDIKNLDKGYTVRANRRVGWFA